jgi:hypothetical protein
MLSQNFPSDDQISSSFSDFCSKFGLFSLLSACGARKVRGVPVSEVFSYLFSIVFKGVSTYQDQRRGRGGKVVGKDCVHRFMQSVHIDWNRFISRLCSLIIETVLTPIHEHEKNERTCLVIDDSPFYRNSSKRVELLARCKDHSKKNCFFKGFRMLTLGYTDGTSFLPVAHSLLGTENDKMQINGAKEVPQGTPGHFRRVLSRTKATEAMLALLDYAKAAAVKARYVLYDSWFSCPAQIFSVLEKGYHVVCMVKKGSTKYYDEQGENPSTVSDIFRRNRKRRGTSKYLLSTVVTIKDKDGRLERVKLVFVRNRNKSKEYLVLLSTDTSLDERQIIAIYGFRWSIEVFFKSCKSQLRLEKGNQALNYDEICAHVSFVFVQYMMLSYQRRISTDERTIGELFLYMVEEIQDSSFEYAFTLLLYMFIDQVCKSNQALQEQLFQQAEAFIDDLPTLMRDQLKRAS